MRFWRHSFLIFGLFVAFCIGPLLLLVGVSTAVCVGLISGGSSLAAAALIARLATLRLVSRWQQVCISLSLVAFNPVLVAFWGVENDIPTVAELSAMPLGLAFAISSWGSMRLLDGDRSVNRTRGPMCPMIRRGISLMGKWLASRITLVGLPMYVLSFQLALYLPIIWPPSSRGMFVGPDVALFVIMMSALFFFKCCLICFCMAQNHKVPLFLVSLCFTADWVSGAHIFGLISEATKSAVLLFFLDVAGLVHCFWLAARLRLQMRWRQRLVLRQPLFEASDSDGEDPVDGIIEDFLAGWRISQNRRRRFLRSTRCALVTSQEEGNVGQAQTQTTGPGSGQQSQACASSSELPTLKVEPGMSLCTICLVEIQTGDRVRPLPSCNHVYHARCLENWIRQGQEETTCPVCRKPVLKRKPSAEGMSLSFMDTLPRNNSDDDGSDTDGSSPTLSGSCSNCPSEEERGGGRREDHVERVAGQVSWTELCSSIQSQHANTSPASSALRDSLAVSQVMANAALIVTRGDPNSAAAVILEHQNVLAAVYDQSSSELVHRLPDGLLEGVIQANPALQPLSAGLCGQLLHVSLPQTLRPWSDLQVNERTAICMLLLMDVSARTYHTQLEQLAPEA